jgi:glycosyltransferase involved in cell wall biosynthesis
MKKIVIDNRISGTTTGRYSDKLVEYLHKLTPQHEIIVLTRKHRMKFMKEIAPNFTIVESNYADFSFGEQFGLARQLYKLHADLVHFPMVQQPLLYTKPKVTSMLDLTTIRFKNPAKNPVVFTIKQKIYWVVNWLAAKSSRQIITISNYVRDELIKIFHISPDKITTTHNAADKITEPSEPMKDLVGKQFIFYTGRPQPHKNLARLIEAYVLLQKTLPDLVLVLSGKKDALYQQHEDYVNQQGIKGVVFTGFTSEGQLRWLYENTAAYVFPSLSEGFGLPGLEAMIHGAPVVSSNATCLPEIYNDAALYFDPLDVQDMANKIGEVLGDKDLRQTLITLGHKQAAKYSWEKLAKQTLEIFERALK